MNSLRRFAFPSLGLWSLPVSARAASASEAPWLGWPAITLLLGASLAGTAWVVRRRLVAGRRIQAPPPPEIPDGASTATGTPQARAESVERHASAANELEIYRRLGRDVYWEQDASGRLTRVDAGETESPLRLRLGGFRWDEGGLPLDDPNWDDHRRTLEQQAPFQRFTWVCIDSSGRVRIAIDSGLPRHDASGRFIGYAGVSRDAGSEIVADRARRLAVLALLAAVEPVVWIEANRSGEGSWQIIWANGAACRLFDRTDRELRELPPQTLFGRESQAAVGSLEAALRSRRELRLHADLARKYGEMRSVEIRLEPLASESTLRPCAALLLHDRSAEQEKLLEEGRAIGRLREKIRERSLELEVTAKELESFSYTVSHDLRAPIRVIEGFTRILQEDYGTRLDRLGLDLLDRIMSAAHRMTSMIDALLDLSRLSNQALATEPIDLSRLGDVIAEELKASQPDRKVSIRIQPGMRIEGDRTLLRVMLENLLGNAWKYTSRKPSAQIEFGMTGTESERVYFVSDDGEGFDMRFADRLFGVFQRLHSASDFPGTGVGLATVQRIVRRHGGRIWAESEPGQGTRFLFTFWEKPAR